MTNPKQISMTKFQNAKQQGLEIWNLCFGIYLVFGACYLVLQAYVSIDPTMSQCPFLWPC